MIRVLLELTLVITLFTDASSINLKSLFSFKSIPFRLLFIGLPLTIVFGFGLAKLIFPEIDYDDVDQTQGLTINIVLENCSPKYRSESIDKILNGMILFKFLRFPLNDCGYYEKYSSIAEINQSWDKKKHLKRKRWSQE